MFRRSPVIPLSWKDRRILARFRAIYGAYLLSVNPVSGIIGNFAIGGSNIMGKQKIIFQNDGITIRELDRVSGLYSAKRGKEVFVFYGNTDAIDRAEKWVFDFDQGEIDVKHVAPGVGFFRRGKFHEIAKNRDWIPANLYATDRIGDPLGVFNLGFIRGDC